MIAFGQGTQKYSYPTSSQQTLPGSSQRQVYSQGKRSYLSLLTWDFGSKSQCITFLSWTKLKCGFFYPKSVRLKWSRNEITPKSTSVFPNALPSLSLGFKKKLPNPHQSQREKSKVRSTQGRVVTPVRGHTSQFCCMASYSFPPRPPRREVHNVWPMRSKIKLVLS